ncbi:MAG TPA: hypothetical protein P5230_02375 [Candidatus Magasanikbacteria bacterium]|nr:hypothetical protein [Candidatus Magasanikbacteria bacterium]
MNKDFLKQLKVIILLFVLLDGAIGFGVYKVEKMIQAKDQEIKNYLQELERKSRGSQNLKEALARVRNTKATMNDYEKYLFRSGQELDLITDLENIAAKNKINQKIESSNLDKISDNTITLNLRASGSYKNILSYLADLENYDYFLQITSLDLNPVYDLKNPDNSVGALTDLRISLKLYVNS